MEADGEEIDSEMGDLWYLRRLDNGLFTLQTVDYILAWIVMEDDGVRRPAHFPSYPAKFLLLGSNACPEAPGPKEPIFQGHCQDSTDLPRQRRRGQDHFRGRPRWRAVTTRDSAQPHRLPRSLLIIRTMYEVQYV